MALWCLVVNADYHLIDAFCLDVLSILHHALWSWVVMSSCHGYSKSGNTHIFMYHLQSVPNPVHHITPQYSTVQTYQPSTQSESLYTVQSPLDRVL